MINEKLRANNLAETQVITLKQLLTNRADLRQILNYINAIIANTNGIPEGYLQSIDSEMKELLLAAADFISSPEGEKPEKADILLGQIYELRGLEQIEFYSNGGQDLRSDIVTPENLYVSLSTSKNVTLNEDGSIVYKNDTIKIKHQILGELDLETFPDLNGWGVLLQSSKLYQDRINKIVQRILEIQDPEALDFLFKLPFIQFIFVQRQLNYQNDIAFGYQTGIHYPGTTAIYQFAELGKIADQLKLALAGDVSAMENIKLLSEDANRAELGKFLTQWIVAKQYIVQYINNALQNAEESIGDELANVLIEHYKLLELLAPQEAHSISLVFQALVKRYMLNNGTRTFGAKLSEDGEPYAVDARAVETQFGTFMIAA